MKKMISMLLCLALLFCYVSGIAEKGSWTDDSSPVTLNVYYNISADDGTASESWGSDPVSMQWIADTGVNINLETAVDDNDTQLNMRMANRQYPDILICKQNWSMLNSLVENGVILKLNDLQETAAPGFIARNMGANSVLTVRERFQTTDVYGFPLSSLKSEDLKNPELSTCENGIMVLKSVYEAIGEPDMTTIDGFLSALRLVKEKYPNLIPVQASRNASTDGEGNPRCIYKLFSMFDLQGKYYYDEATEIYRKYWYSPNYLELLKFVNTLYNEELMDPTELTSSSDVLRSRIFSGKVFCLMYTEASAVDWLDSELASAGVQDEWVFVNQPSVNGTRGYTNDDIAGGVDGVWAFIFNTPNANRAMQWLDYLMTDKAQIEMVVGIQGNAWDYDENGKFVVYDSVAALPDDIKQREYGMNLYYMFRQGLHVNLIAKESGSPKQQDTVRFMNRYYRDNSFIMGISPENYDPAGEEIKIYTNIKEFYAPWIIQMITCPPEQVEAKYQEMMTKLEQLGQGKLDVLINDAFQSQAISIEQYGADLDLSYLGN